MPNQYTKAKELREKAALETKRLTPYRYLQESQSGLTASQYRRIQTMDKFRKLGKKLLKVANRVVTGIMPYTELVVATGNYDTSRVTIDRIVIHTMVGTVAGAAARFAGKGNQVSAHYGVGYDGKLYHWLEEMYTAYHAGNYPMNQRSIGIEHEDMGNYNSPRPDVLYQTSARLVADIAKYYGIPLDRQHVLKHSEVIATGCPDSLDIDKIVSMAQAINNPAINWTAIAQEARQWVFGYGTKGSVTDRMAAIINIYKKYGISN